MIVKFINFSFRVDLSVSTTMNQKNAMKLFIHNADKPTSNKEIKKTETLKLRIKYKQTVCNKAENAIIHKNLIRHQNWMFKE